jgi:hypothetical protein
MWVRLPPRALQGLRPTGCRARPDAQVSQLNTVRTVEPRRYSTAAATKARAAVRAIHRGRISLIGSAYVWSSTQLRPRPPVARGEGGRHARDEAHPGNGGGHRSVPVERQADRRAARLIGQDCGRARSSPDRTLAIGRPRGAERVRVARDGDPLHRRRWVDRRHAPARRDRCGWVLVGLSLPTPRVPPWGGGLRPSGRRWHARAGRTMEGAGLRSCRRCIRRRRTPKQPSLLRRRFKLSHYPTTRCSRLRRSYRAKCHQVARLGRLACQPRNGPIRPETSERAPVRLTGGCGRGPRPNRRPLGMLQ